MRKVLYRSLLNPGRYFHGAPTRAQAKDIFWERLKNNTKRYWRRRPAEGELVVFLRNGTEIHVEGLDRPERIEGQPWHGCHITEIGNVKNGSWEAHIRPVLSDTGGWAIFDGVPEGRRGDLYRFAQKATDGVIPSAVPMVGVYRESSDDPAWCYYHWISADVLPLEEIEAAKRDMDPRMFRQEYEGSFENYEGLLYHTFTDRNINPRIAEYKDFEPLYLTCDFNKAPMVWEVAQIRPIASRRTVLNIVELSISIGAKTVHNTDLFIKRFKNHKNRIVYLHGDASGQWDSTVSYQTDYKIIQDKLHSAGWKVVNKLRSGNPSVNDRVNITCSLLQPAMGKPRHYVHPDCHFLIQDYRGVVDDGKGSKDKDDPMLTHASDANDYLVYDEFAPEFFNARARNIC